MQDFPLTVECILRHGERMYPTRSVTTQLAQGRERITFAELAARSRQVAGVLDRLGVSADGRVGSFGWNTANHTALYFGVPSTGRVLHTLNIRLFPEQLVYTVEHAEDEVVFVDRSLLRCSRSTCPGSAPSGTWWSSTTGRRTRCPTTPGC